MPVCLNPFEIRASLKLLMNKQQAWATVLIPLKSGQA